MADEERRYLSETTLRLPNEAEWTALAKIANIPNDPSVQQKFRLEVCDAIRYAWRRSITVVVASNDLVCKLERIAEHARELGKALLVRKEDAVTAEYLLNRRCRDRDASIACIDAPLTASIDALCKDAENAVTATKRKRGQRLPETYLLHLYPFFRDISAAVASGKGHLEFNKNTKKGTLVDFLDKLSGYLPPDFLPSDYVDTLSRFKGWLPELENK